jgi:hypothetical protein
MFGNTAGYVRALIIDENILPVPVGLGKHTLDTLSKITLSIVERRYDANKWRRPPRGYSLAGHQFVGPEDWLTHLLSSANITHVISDSRQ